MVSNESSDNLNKIDEFEIRDFLSEFINLLFFIRKNLKFISLITFIFFVVSNFVSSREKVMWNSNIYIDITNPNIPKTNLRRDRKNTNNYSTYSPEYYGKEKVDFRSLPITKKSLQKVILSSEYIGPAYNFYQSKKINNSINKKQSLNPWILDHIKIIESPGTSLIEINITDDDKEMVKDITKKLVTSYNNLSKELFIDEYKKIENSITSDYLESKKFVDKTIKDIAKIQQNKNSIKIIDNKLVFQDLEGISLEQGLEIIKLRNRINLGLDVMEQLSFEKQLITNKINVIEPWNIKFDSEPQRSPKKLNKKSIFYISFLGFISSIFISKFFLKNPKKLF